MKTSKHTPGPWFVNRISGKTFIGGSPLGGMNAIQVATVTALKEGTDANARLMAGAPTLLEEAKHALFALREF